LQTWIIKALGTVVLVLLCRQGWMHLEQLLSDQPLPIDLHNIGFLVVLVGLALGWISLQLGGGLIIFGVIWATLGLGVGVASGDLGVSALFRAAFKMLPAVVVAAVYLHPTALLVRPWNRAGT
jgi:hypothetical protein